MNNQQHIIAPVLTAITPPYPLPYDFTVTYYEDANSCIGTVFPPPVQITVHPVPEIEFSALAYEICEGEVVICLGKSTYARCGIIVNVTPLEPGWEGYVTLEFSNTTPLPAKIYANEGVAQFIFLKGNEKPEVTYADRDGKYMGQTGVTLPKV